MEPGLGASRNGTRSQNAHIGQEAYPLGVSDFQGVGKYPVSADQHWQSVNQNSCSSDQDAR